MKEMYSGEQAKAIDTHAIDTMGMPSLVLMGKGGDVGGFRPFGESRTIGYFFMCMWNEAAMTASVWHVSYMKWDIRRQLQS